MNDLFPAELDLQKSIAYALKEGMTAINIADAIFAGFDSVDPIQVERLADALQYLADTKEKYKKTDVPL